MESGRAIEGSALPRAQEEAAVFPAMTEEQASSVAELLEANGVDEARVVENGPGWSVEIWVHGRGEPDTHTGTIYAAATND